MSSLYLCLASTHASTLTKTHDKWKGDIPDLTGGDWEDSVGSYISTMISAKDHFIQLKFLHRANYTLVRLAGIYSDVSPLCSRCQSSTGTFFHLVWMCHHIHRFWEKVIAVLNNFGDWSLGQEPALALLGSMEDVVATSNLNLFLFFALYYARREILIRWKQPAPPTIDTWKAEVNAVLLSYRLTYESRNCPKKFDKVWWHWIDAYCSTYLVLNCLHPPPFLPCLPHFPFAPFPLFFYKWSREYYGCICLSFLF